MGPSRFTIRQAMALIALLAVELGLLPAPYGVFAAVLTPLAAYLYFNRHRRYAAWGLGILALFMPVAYFIYCLWSIDISAASRLVPVPFAFRATDRVTGRPVGDVEVRVSEPGFRPFPTFRTGADGRGDLADQFNVVGPPEDPTQQYVDPVWSRWPRLSADGYQTAWFPLSGFSARLPRTGNAASPVAIPLEPSPPTANGPLSAFAGGYVRAYTRRVESLWITPGGRYRWVVRRDRGVTDVTEGRVVSEGGRLALEADETPPDLLPARWGDRLYLVEEDGTAGFRGDVAGRSEPRDHPFGRHWLREGDWEAPAEGVPVWPE
jgi:hypothetical protein